MCPFAKAEKRLTDSVVFWNQAADAYQNPIGFVRHIQTAIQTLRSVTWVLQSGKEKLPGFDDWYKAWQDKMRNDRVMRWVVDMRNKIEKVGDIEPGSKLRLTFCQDWLADDESEVEFSPAFTADEAAHLFATMVGPSSRKEEALIRFRREWRHQTLVDFELLDALIQSYQFLVRLLLDAHGFFGNAETEKCQWFHEHTAKNILPEEMSDRSLKSSSWYRLIDKTIAQLKIRKSSMTREEAEASYRSHYGDHGEPARPKGDNLAENCAFWMTLAKRLLSVDRYLIPTFLIECNDFWIPIMAQPRDRADKHVIVREVADVIFAHQANAVTFITEAWTAPIKVNEPFKHAVHHPDRGECILVECANQDGDFVNACCNFRKTESGIDFDVEEQINEVTSNHMAPIRKAFGKLKKPKL
jgi:hypothetical protein